MNIKHSVLGFIIVFVLSYFTVAPLFIGGFFPVHDDTQVARVFTMQKSLKDGMFPVRWVSDLGYGYGYPIFNFYAPLAYYFGGTMMLFGFDAITATKIMMGVGMVLAALSMYVLAKEFWGVVGGVVSAVLYVYAPFHAVDLYVRGDVAELWAYGFIPLVFYGIWKLYKERAWKYVMLSAIGYAAIILSHNLTAMMVTPFFIVAIIILSAVLYRRKKLYVLSALPFALCIGLLLSAFYWLPALFEMQYTNVLGQIGGGADFRDHFVCLLQLWESQWGFGGSVPGCLDGLSFRIGKMHLLIVLVAIVLLFVYRKDRGKKGMVFFGIAGLFVSLFLLLPIAKPIWEAVPLMAFFQYPWRFLLMVGFFSSFIAGFPLWVLGRLDKKNNIYLLFGASIIVVATLFLYIKLFSPQTIGPKTEKELISREAISWTASKISDEYMPKGFYKPSSPDETHDPFVVQEGIARFSDTKEKTQRIETKVSVTKEARIEANIAYFPAWKLFVDNKTHPFIVTSFGFLFSLPDGVHLVRFEFVQTPIEKIANLLSFAGILMVLIGIIYQRKRGIHQ